MTQVSESASSGLYSSKAALMAGLHAIMTMLVFVPYFYVINELSPTDLRYTQIALQQLIPVEQVALTAFVGYLIYSKSQRIYLLSHPTKLFQEVLLVIIYRLVIGMVMTLLYLLVQHTLVPNSLLYLVFFSFDPLVIFDLTFSQIFLSSNIFILVAPVVTTLISTYFIILGLHYMKNTASESSPAPISRVLTLAGGLVLYLLFLLVGSVEAVATFSPTANDAIVSAYRFNTVLNFVGLIVLGVLLWYVYPASLGIDASKSLLVNQKSQQQVVLLGMLGAMLPLFLNFGIFNVSAFSLPAVLQFLALDFVYLLYSGFLFSCEILVAITFKFGLVPELSDDQPPVYVQPSAVTT